MKKLVSLPVSSLTKKVLIHRHGNEPLRPRTHSLFSKHLRHKGKREYRQELRQHTLDTFIELEVTGEVATNISLRGEAVGMYLHNIHKEELFRYVEANVENDNEALATVIAYLDRHGVEEDDYSYQSAARLYRRWKKEKEKIRTTKGVESVHQVLSGKTTVLLSAQQAEKAAKLFFSMEYSSVIKIDKKNVFSIYAFILYHYTHDSFATLKSKLALTDRSNAYRSYKRGYEYLQSDPRLIRWLTYCIDRVKENAAPVAS